MSSFIPVESICKQIQQINVTKHPLQIDDLKKLELKQWPQLNEEKIQQYFTLLPEARIRRINYIAFINIPDDDYEYLICSECKKETTYLLEGKCGGCCEKSPESLEDNDIEEGHFIRICDLCDFSTTSKFGIWTHCVKESDNDHRGDEESGEDEESDFDLCQECSQTDKGKEMISSSRKNLRKIEHPDPYGSLYDWYPVSKYEEGWILWNLNSKSPLYHQGAVFHYDDHYRVGLFTFPLEEIFEQDQKKMDLFLKKKCLPTYYG